MYVLCTWYPYSFSLFIPITSELHTSVSTQKNNACQVIDKYFLFLAVMVLAKNARAYSLVMFKRIIYTLFSIQIFSFWKPCFFFHINDLLHIPSFKYMYACIYACIHAYQYAYMYACMCACMQACIIHELFHLLTPTSIHTCKNAYIHGYSCMST